MTQIREFITIYYIEVTISLSISIIVLFLALFISQYKYKKSMRNYNKLVNGIRGINLEEVLINVNEDIANINTEISKIIKNTESINTRLSFAIQRVGFVRYNAFRDIGSELSFSLALLDEFKNGFVYSSIYGRENAVSYGKPIKNGICKIPLSAEEMLALDRAIKGEPL